MDSPSGLTPPPVDFVRAHRVCWETVAHRERSHGSVRIIGYDVVLMAQCVGDGPWDPGSTRVIAMFEELQAIALRALPPACCESVSLSAFDPTFHLRGAASWASEVQLTIEVRHRDTDYFAPLDPAETSCARRIEQGLRRLGLQQGTWKESIAA